MIFLSRLLAPGLAACGLMVSLNASAQSPSAARDLSRELAPKVAAAVSPLPEVLLVVVEPDPAIDDTDSGFTLRLVASEIETHLRQHNIRVVRSSVQGKSSMRTVDRARAEVRLLCSANLRDRLCSADVRTGDGRNVLVAARPRTVAAAAASTRPLAALDVRPLFAQRVPILDLVVLGDRMLVLDVSALTVYERNQARWQVKASAPLASNRPWPRDVRGRLMVAGATVSVFLPGLSCRGSIDPLAVTCANGDAPWPIGVPDATMAAGTNYFSSPGTPPFFTATPMPSRSQWLVAATDGRLLLLDETFQILQVASTSADDVAAVTQGCSGDDVIAAERGAGSDHLIRAYELLDRDLVRLAPPVSMTGPVTAMWEAPGRGAVLVVVRNRESGRYEAFHVGITCAR